MDMSDLISASVGIHVDTYVIVMSVRVCLNQNLSKLKQISYFALWKGG